jgi:hypothetical protein
MVSVPAYGQNPYAYKEDKCRDKPYQKTAYVIGAKKSEAADGRTVIQIDLTF